MKLLSALPPLALSVLSPLALTRISACGDAHEIPTTTEACACEQPGHGARVCDDAGCGPCMCLPLEPVAPDPVPATTFYVDPDVSAGGDGSAATPWRILDWPAVDQALVRGDVLVVFSALEQDGASAEVWPVRLDILRTDTGPHRVVIDGGGAYNASDAAPRWLPLSRRAHAVVPGVSTGFEDVARHRVTVRGLEVTGSEDKGVYWRAGDGIVLEDLIVHDNRGTPAINLEYANRTGLPSASFILRNSHVYNQFAGECVYIGGAEGEDLDAHRYVEIRNNLIHHCWDPVNVKHDGINIKDRIGDLRLERNVVFTTNWGIEVASPGTLRGNLVFDTFSDGFHLNDYWGLGLSGLVLADNVALRAGENGIRLDAENRETTGVTIVDSTVIDSRQAGLLFGGTAGLEVLVDGALIAQNGVGIDGWGEVGLELGSCLLDGNRDDDAGVLEGATAGCERRALTFGDLEAPAGPDGIFFSGDEPWLLEPDRASP